MRKDREDRYERGVTKREIIKGILTQEEGIPEPDLREYLKETLNLTAPRNIKSHLEDLERENIIIKKMQRGGANIWSINSYERDYRKVANYILEKVMPRGENCELDKNSYEFFKLPGMQFFVSKTPNLDQQLNVILMIIAGYFGNIDSSRNFTINYPNSFDNLKMERIERVCRQALKDSPTLFQVLTLTGSDRFAIQMIWGLIEELFEMEISHDDFVEYVFYSIILAPTIGDVWVIFNFKDMPEMAKLDVPSELLLKLVTHFDRKEDNAKKLRNILDESGYEVHFT